MIECPYNVIFCRLESCLVRSLQARSLRQQLLLLLLKFMISLLASNIWFCIRYDYLQDQNSAGSLFEELMFCTQYAFLACMPSWDLCKMCGRQLQEFLSLSTLHTWMFFHVIFPYMNLFWFFAPQPKIFLMIRPLMNGKGREIPVTPPERELQWCYYSPSIFLASSQTAPAPKVVLTLKQDGSP